MQKITFDETKENRNNAKKRYWLRKAMCELGISEVRPELQKDIERKAKELERAYKRQWSHNNPDRIKATRERYWQKKAMEMSKITNIQKCDAKTAHNIGILAKELQREYNRKLAKNKRDREKRSMK